MLHIYPPLAKLCEAPASIARLAGSFMIGDYTLSSLPKNKEPAQVNI